MNYDGDILYDFGRDEAAPQARSQRQGRVVT